MEAVEAMTTGSALRKSVTMFVKVSLATLSFITQSGNYCVYRDEDFKMASHAK